MCSHTRGSSHQLCFRCGEVKLADEFAWRRTAKKQRDSFCRPCHSAYKQEHYAANRQRYIDQAGVRRRGLTLERTKYLIELFTTHPCVDCGESDAVVLEFDHLGNKLFDIGPALAYKRWQTILDEIAKCELYVRTVIVAARRSVAARFGCS